MQVLVYDSIAPVVLDTFECVGGWYYNMASFMFLYTNSSLLLFTNIIIIIIIKKNIK